MVGRRQRDTSGQVAQAWAEARRQARRENEDAIRGAAGICIVRVDLQLRAMVQRPVQDVRGLGHNLDAVGAMLIGKVRIKADAGFVPISER